MQEDQTETPDARWPKVLVEFVEVIDSCLIEQGLTAGQATKSAKAITERLAWHLGGRQFYMPKGDAVKRIYRDAEIYRRLGRESAHDLAKEYGMSAQQIYGIASAQRALARKACRIDAKKS